VLLQDESAAVIKMTASAEEPKSSFAQFSETFSNLLPVWTVSVAALGLLRPAVLGGISTSAFTALLGMLMLSMGITLSSVLKRPGVVLKRPGVVGLGLFMCYGLMPAMALGLSKVLGLSPALTAGMVLIGSINGGQGSNLCTYIANGDVALSVMMTTVTTIGAIFMTPLICKLLLGGIVPVDAVGVVISTIQDHSQRREIIPGPVSRSEFSLKIMNNKSKSPQNFPLRARPIFAYGVVP
jgi:BASS family bile acid:Na+ symporter